MLNQVNSQGVVMTQQDFDELKEMVAAYQATPRAAGAVDPSAVIDIIVTVVTMFLAPANPALAAIIVKVAAIVKSFFTA